MKGSNETKIADLWGAMNKFDRSFALCVVANNDATLKIAKANIKKPWQELSPELKNGLLKLPPQLFASEGMKLTASLSYGTLAGKAGTKEITAAPELFYVLVKEAIAELLRGGTTMIDMSIAPVLPEGITDDLTERIFE
jgi:hypothetical protein